MPFKPARPCGHPGCSALVGGQGKKEQYCEKHKGGHRDDYPRRHPENQRLYHLAAWGRLRQWQLNRYPLCAECEESADTVHHLIDHHGDYSKFMDVDNLQSLCKRHHDEYTAKTVGFGKQNK